MTYKYVVIYNKGFKHEILVCRRTSAMTMNEILGFSFKRIMKKSEISEFYESIFTEKLLRLKFRR